ncbi:MAG: nucleotidyltransferase [Paludibacteraceae bacterium]|nr:nucleotidyltransferase [Paludibacteraceae bacterium]
MKPTLFVLAAGMGSRYGGLKQLDGLGPHGETIMDYSIYDAIQAGFGKVVFVIRRVFEQDFREKIVSKYENRIPVELVFQDLDNLPAGFTVPEGREKPWGTNHAVLMGKDVIHEPFAVINADDYYGRESFKVLADYLSSIEGTKGQYAMVGYRVANTLSESGTVARGVCETDENGYLTKVTERTKILREEDGVIRYIEEDGKTAVEDNTPVSMNMWAFTPDYFKYSEDYFVSFLKEHGQELKSEFFIPLMVDVLIHSGKATCRVLDTPSKWFGVTYATDRPQVVAKFAELVEKGIYPSPLF